MIRVCHFHRKPSCQRRHQARHQAGESLDKAICQSVGKKSTTSCSHPPITTLTPTQLDLCPAILCSPCANSGLIAEAVRSHQGAIKSP